VNRTPSSAVVAALMSAAVAAPARGQAARTGNAYVTASGDFRLTAARFVGTAHPTEFVEPSTIATTYRPWPAAGFDVGGGLRVWRRLAVGAGISRFQKASGGGVSGEIPHPFFFNRPRAVAGEATGLTRAETAIYVQALWVTPLNRRWQLAVSGGPSLFRVNQDLVGDVTIAQAYPYDTATYAGAVTERRSTSRIGVNTGVDLTYLFARHVGVGMAATFSHARAHLTSASGDPVDVDAGGAHVGGGIRFRF
jgi:hypothetical protein